jgi:soluble epoxide hydrolase / lipid-phosphate phosphatase
MLMRVSCQDAPLSIEMYSFRRASDDIAELARQLGLTKIILGGHDWQGSLYS